MDKKRKSPHSNTDSIDTNKKKKSKKSEDVIAEDVKINQNIESSNEDSETVIHSISKKKRKDKKNKEEIAESIVENHDSKISFHNSSNKKRKDKEIKDKVSKDNDEDVNEFSKSAVHSINNFRAISNSGIPKKIIFVDDEPHEVSVTAISKTKKSKAFKKSKEHNNDILTEEVVKDEDIDKFCDELGEEDNQQYENWVQLIEASLSSNKKKPK